MPRQKMPRITMFDARMMKSRSLAPLQAAELWLRQVAGVSVKLAYKRPPRIIPTHPQHRQQLPSSCGTLTTPDGRRRSP